MARIYIALKENKYKMNKWTNKWKFRTFNAWLMWMKDGCRWQKVPPTPSIQRRQNNGKAWERSRRQGVVGTWRLDAALLHDMLRWRLCVLPGFHGFQGVSRRPLSMSLLSHHVSNVRRVNATLMLESQEMPCWRLMSVYSRHNMGLYVLFEHGMWTSPPSIISDILILANTAHAFTECYSGGWTMEEEAAEAKQHECTWPVCHFLAIILALNCHSREVTLNNCLISKDCASVPYVVQANRRWYAGSSVITLASVGKECVWQHLKPSWYFARRLTNSRNRTQSLFSKTVWFLVASVISSIVFKQHVNIEISGRSGILCLTDMLLVCMYGLPTWFACFFTACQCCIWLKGALISCCDSF